MYQDLSTFFPKTSSETDLLAIVVVAEHQKFTGTVVILATVQQNVRETREISEILEITLILETHEVEGVLHFLETYATSAIVIGKVLEAEAEEA
jgi:hypothetical protein